MKEKVMKLFLKIKKNIVPFMKKAVSILIILIGLFSLFAFVSVPFMHNVVTGKLGMIIWYPACFIFVVFYIINIYKSKKQEGKYPVFNFLANIGIVPIMTLFCSAFVINYYETNYNWWWTIFVFVLIFIPVFILCRRDFIKKQKEIIIDNSIIASKTCWKYIIFYWIIDLFYMTVFNYWIENTAFQEKWLLPQFIFGVIAMVFIFYNLTLAFLSNTKKQWLGLLQDFILGIGITIYLIFLIPDDDLQTIVLTIIAAVYGGLLTLVGVAWTIKDTNDKRQEDIKRTDAERKEEERKKHIPYVKVSYVTNEPIFEVNAHITRVLDLENPNDLAKINNKVFYQINVKDFVIKNISKENIILKGIVVYGDFHVFSKQEILEPNKYCRIKASNNWALCVPNSDVQIVLIVNDVLENTYEIECNISKEFGNYSRFETEINDEKYKGFNFDYHISSVDLPKLIETK